MTMELKERMSLAISRAGKTKTDVARACGVSRPAVSKWCTGGSKDITGAAAIKVAAYLGVNAEWLLSGRGEMVDGEGNVGAFYADDEIPKGYVAVPECQVEGGAGDCGEPAPDEVEDAKSALYREDWFKEHGVKVEHCKRLKVRGNSMAPILFDGDAIRCDCTPGQRVQAGKIYAFCFGNGLRVKRLYPKLNGGLLVKSENPDEPSEEILPDEMTMFNLIGRVIDRSGSGPF